MKKFLLSIAVVAAVLIGAWVAGSLYRNGKAGAKEHGDGTGASAIPLPGDLRVSIQER